MWFTQQDEQNGQDKFKYVNFDIKSLIFPC
jgi:hypothetical protein